MAWYVQCGIAWCRFESNDSPLPCHNQRPACPNNTLTPYDEDDSNAEDIDDDADRADEDGENDDEEEDEMDSGDCNHHSDAGIGSRSGGQLE